MSRRRPSLANPGEVWEWQSDLLPSFYILHEDHRARQGQMYKGLDLATGMVVNCFMTYDLFNGWERLA